MYFAQIRYSGIPIYDRFQVWPNSNQSERKMIWYDTRQGEACMIDAKLQSRNMSDINRYNGSELKILKAKVKDFIFQLGFNMLF